MKNIIYIGLLVFFFGCEEDKGMFTEKYVFQDILYTLEKDDGIKEEIFFPQLSEFSNPTDNIIYETIDMLNGIGDDSRFSSDDERAFSLLVGQNVRVKTPIAINAHNEIVLSKYVKFKYGDENDNSPSDIDGKYTVEIPPFQKVKVFKTVVADRIYATYTIILKTEVSGKEVRIKGKWRGNIIKRIEPEPEYSAIN